MIPPLLCLGKKSQVYKGPSPPRVARSLESTGEGRHAGQNLAGRIQSFSAAHIGGYQEGLFLFTGQLGGLPSLPPSPLAPTS